MVHFVKGNLLDSKAEALVNTVNTMGVMGKVLPYNLKINIPIITNFTEKLVKIIC